jgi:translation initiation factor IF-2
MKARTPRTPIVAVMGHIDHGKSTLLDYIRKTNTTDKEKGGITQHLAAYQAKYKDSSITFLDTPGHAAFSGIRERGATAADIVILVVSAEDGVKPQTIEAINDTKRSVVSFLVAINKIDKPNANIDKTKQELAEHEVLLEGWGGNVPVIPISAKTGEGVDDLLETLVLLAEVNNVSYDPDLPAEGFVLESQRDPQKGISATLIIKDGAMKKGGILRAGQALAPVREDAKAGEPVSISHWDQVPPVGSEFRFYNSKSEALNSLPTPITKSQEAEINGTKKFPIIIKADAIGSLEAIVQEIKKLNNEKINFKIISQGAGSISEADVRMALTFPEIVILGFNVKTDNSAGALAIRNSIPIKTFGIIYELTEWASQELTKRIPKEEVAEVGGRASIIKIFSVNRSKQVVGGRVEEGTIEAGSNVRIMRRETEIGDGHIRELQSKKIKTGRVGEGSEFGSLIESKVEIAPGDKIISIKKVLK